VRDEPLRAGHLVVLGELLDRLGLIKRTIPVTTSPTPMIDIGRKSLSHPSGQLTGTARPLMTVRHHPLSLRKNSNKAAARRRQGMRVCAFVGDTSC